MEILEDRTLLSSITGTVFNDLNGDGLQGSTEPGLQNWVVDLFQGQTVLKQVLTNANGSYSFINLAPGTFTIQEELEPSWLRTSTPATYAVDTSGGDVSGVVFGNFQLVRISGTVFNDLNGDGLQEPGEPGLQGWTVDLIKGQSVAKRQTDSSGNFTFSGVGPGSCTIQEELQSGWVQTSPPTTYSVTTTSGTDLSGKVFGVLVPQADLAVTKTGPAAAIAGDPANLTYTITVTNNGPSDAQSLVLSDLLPPGETFVSQFQLAGPVFTLANSGNSISDTISTLAAQASASFIVAAHIPANIPNGTVLHNQATIISNTGDPDPSNNASAVDTTVASQAELTVNKTGPAETIAGDPANLTYTITLTNYGPSDAQGVALSDALPAGETVVSQTQTSGPAFALGSSGNTISDTLGTLAAGASASFTVVAHVNPSVLEGTVLSNTATISSNTTDPDPTNNSSTASTLVHASTHETTTILASSANPSVLSQPVTLTATVSSTVSGVPMPNGNVDFFDTTTNADLGTIALSDGAAELTISSLTVGEHVIQASYSGDSIFQPSVGMITQSVQYNFSGYLPPLNNHLALAGGRTVPIKFQLSDYNGNFINSLSAITSLQVSGPSGVISLTASLSYDLSANQFIANWKTKGLPAGTYTISLVLADGTTKTLSVQLTTNGHGGVTQIAAGSDGGDNSGPTLDEQDAFWSTIAGSTALERLTDLAAKWSG